MAIYPLSLTLDPKTRETLVFNAEGKLIATIPADRVSREWPEDADPARVTLQLDLLPSEDVEPYLFTESRIADYEKARASKATKSGGMVLRSLGASEFGIAGVQRLTNGNMEITVTNGTDAAEVFAYTVWHTSSVSVVVWTNEFDEVLTNSLTAWHPVSPSFDGIESAWECLTTNLVLSGGVGVYEDANISSNARVRFYAVANRLDSDGDGLTDGAEIFIHRTDPENPDTDGDGLSDYEEVQLGTEPNSPNIVKMMYFVDELPEEPARRSSSEGDLYVTWSNLQGKAIYTARLKEGYGEYTSSNITASIPPKYYLTKERIYHTECTGVRTNPYPNDAVGTMQFIMSQSNYCRKAYDPLGWPSSPIDHTCFGYSDFSRIFYSDCYNIVEMVWNYYYTQPSTAFPYSYTWWEIHSTCPPDYHTTNTFSSTLDTCSFMRDSLGSSSLINVLKPISTTESYNYRTNDHFLGCDIYSSPTYELYEEYLFDEYTDSMLEEYTAADLQMFMDDWDGLAWGKRLVRNNHTQAPWTNSLTSYYTYASREAITNSSKLALQALRFRWKVPTETGVVYKIIWQEEFWPDDYSNWPWTSSTELKECNIVGTGSTAYSADIDLLPPATNGTVYLIPASRIDLVIHMPSVIDPSESIIPVGDKLTKGSVTFVNLDNDDNDADYDHGDGAVDGGDDELVKVKLKVKTSSWAPATVRLTATSGATNVAIWTTSNKLAASAYAMGSNLSLWSDFGYESNWFFKTLWVEGVSAHTVQQGTILKMEYVVGSNTYTDEAALTVVGVEQIAWKGNGNSVYDGHALDSDPNWPGGLTPSALRVFPGARMESGAVGPARDKVTAEVTLTVAPPHPISLFLRSFDVDDPTAESSPVDNESLPENNRGDVSGKKSGEFVGEDASGILELIFPENVKTTNCEFQVTMQPGDNFRIMANGDRDYLLRLENHDATQDVGATSAERNVNKQRICNMDVTGTPAEREIRLPDNYASDVLTVWRFLHVEIDSMAAPPSTGPEKNFVDGNLTGVVGNGTVAQRVNLSVNLKTGLTPQDNSANLDSSPSGNGRFENGWIKIGSGGGTPGETQTSSLLGNGDTHIRKNAGIDIPALVSKSGQPNVSGKVIAWSGSAFTLSVSSGTLSTNYNGGSLNVAGISATISTVNTNGGANVVNVTAAPTIPFVLHDDDVDTVLPGSVNLSNLQDSDNSTANRMAPLFIRPVYDGGGSLVNNQTNVSFVRNTESSAFYSWESRANNLPRFWVVYFLAGFQDSFMNLTKDFDPTSEGGTWASANNTPLGAGVLFYLESISDGSLSSDWMSRVTVHELGHNFGLYDSYISPATDGIMHGYAPVGSASADYFWGETDVDTIRSIANPY